MIKPLALSPIDIKKENYELGLFNKTVEKINELVDTVNDLQDHIKFLDERIKTKNFMVDIDKPNPSKRYCAIHRKWQQVYATGETIEKVVQKLEAEKENINDFWFCEFKDNKIYTYEVKKENQ